MAFVKTEVQGAVEIITIDRPKALNALNPEVLADLKAAFEAVDHTLFYGNPGLGKTTLALFLCPIQLFPALFHAEFGCRRFLLVAFLPEF